MPASEPNSTSSAPTGAPDQIIDILMYHSISDAAGPTSIPADLFAAQMQALSETGYHVVDLPDLVRWRRGEQSLPQKTAVITFDDGFKDFEEAAWPILEKHGFPAIVFVPTDLPGGAENWIGANNPSRPLMSWDDIRGLASRGASFGSHTRTHVNLTTLDSDALDEELCRSRQRLEEELGATAPAFAAPYGAVNEVVREKIAQHYEVAVGTGLDRAGSDADFFDLPRLEMHYFRKPDLWRRFLERKADGYFTVRKFARRIRSVLT